MSIFRNEKRGIGRYSLFALFALSSGALSCGPADATAVDESVGQTVEPAYISSTRMWNRTSLSVCFTFHDRDDVKAWVRSAVTATYEAVTDLRFTGWDDCVSIPSASVADIKIQQGTDGIWSRIGTDSAQFYPSMQLNLDPTNWRGVVDATIHEFSHAVGMYHEFDRDDHPVNPDSSRVHADGIKFGDYDYYSASVITYNAFAGRMLSPTDVFVLRQFYGTDAGYDATNRLWATFWLDATVPDTLVPVFAGETLEVGTCGLPFAESLGDTELHLFSGTTEVAQNDDACGAASFLSYLVPATGNLGIRARCAAGSYCQGVVSYTVKRSDLAVTSLSHSPNQPASTSAITFSAVVRNVGSSTAPATSVRFRIGGESTGVLLPVGSLAPGQSATVQRVATLSAQSYGYRATVDPLGLVTEQDENNNERVGTFDVTQAKPDLVVSSLVCTSPGNGGTATVTLRNIGNDYAPPSTAGITVPRTSSLQLGFPGIGVLATATRQIALPSNYSARSGDVCTATADTLGALSELNESNNQGSSAISIR